MRLGILGGTFNPPHLGHLVCAQEAHAQLSLDRVLLVPAHTPPHKPVQDEPGVEHRLELCRMAIRGDEGRFEVSELEAARPGPSYTVDTLEELHSRGPHNELFLIAGGDVAAGFPGWRHPEGVLSLASLAVAMRPGTTRSAVDYALRRVSGGERATFFDMPEIGVSSTMIRRRVCAGEPIKYYAPDAVVSYIDHHRLYAAEARR